MRKCIVYYTDSRLEEELDEKVRHQILKAADGIPVISVSQKPLDFGTNICVGLKPRCYLNLYQQLLTGLKAAPEDSIIYLCEHDVFYHPSHFKFVPPEDNKIYYNTNRHYFRRSVDHFLMAFGKRALSQAVSYRKVILAHAQEQVEARLAGIASPCIGPFATFRSKAPNVDVRHGDNFSSGIISAQFNASTPIEKLEGTSVSVLNSSINYWGTPRRFAEKVGLREFNTDTHMILSELLNPDKKTSPVKVKFLRAGLGGMFNILEFKKGAEIGVKRGHFSEELCKAIPDLSLKCIDDYRPTPQHKWDDVEAYFVTARHKLKDFDAQFIKKSSMQAADEDVPEQSLDFVYIDADHSFNEVMRDIIVWSDRVRPGGVVSGHDYDTPDVKAAVDVYTKIHGIDFFLTEKGESAQSWFFAKKN